MSDKYRRVDRPQPATPMLPNEIRITAQGIRKAYISYGIAKLTAVSTGSSGSSAAAQHCRGV